MLRARFSIVAGLLLLAGAACRDNDRSPDEGAASAFLDNASPEAREALAIKVDYRLTDESFARWEVAQRNLDRLPRSAVPAATSVRGGNVIDRAVARLESSPRARTAIESAGLAVRDFVLQTIALAQATQAAEGGLPVRAGLVPPENFRFVERHRDRIRRAQTAARVARQSRQADETSHDEEQGMVVDSAVSSAGIETSTGDQGPRADTLASEGARGDVVAPPDTTRDSVSVTR